MEKDKKIPKLLSYDSLLELIGQGRSAFVFKIKNTNLALKVFYPYQESTAIEEAAIYEKLEHIPYYPQLHGKGKNYIVMDYIKGTTLFTCLQKGIRVKDSDIWEIDIALKLARNVGLNPSDIHLKNIIIDLSGKVKIIDVARFRQTKKCYQWNDLRRAYFSIYKHSLFPKRIPATFLNLIAFIYKKRYRSILHPARLHLTKSKDGSIHLTK